MESRPESPVSPVLCMAFGIRLCLAVPLSHAAPVAPDPLSLLKDKRVLVINGDNVPEYHKGPRDIVTGKIQRIKTAVGIATLTVAGNADTMTAATLDRYDVIVFNYFSRVEYFMGKPFEKAFRQWVAAGNRGVVGNHNTGSNTKGEWDWFRDSVTSMWYIDHKDQSQPGTIHVTTDPALAAHPVLKGMDARFTGADEWYSFEMKPWHSAESPTWKDCKVLYTLDENSVARLADKMGAFHPVAWIREDALKNRFFFTTLIHSDAGADSDFYHSLLLRAMEFAAGYRQPVSMGGADIARGDATAFATSAREVDVDVTGAFRLTVRSAAGEILYSGAGSGRAAFRPAAFAEAGVYFVTLEHAGGRVARRVMVY
jgi:hypothetical protein